MPGTTTSAAKCGMARIAQERWRDLALETTLYPSPALR
jgi:hypothetical protein